ncbi:MAG: hypothetical protein KIT84_16705 [Labilithrix sp.]|nr:hypothetical protein [Labilithrix sp.]MCW5812672.1 hypothetical protein [Labilithrix sp.]
MGEPSANEQLIGVVDAEMRLVSADRRLARWLDTSPPLEGRLLLDLLPLPARRLALLAAHRLTGQVTLPPAIEGRTLVARSAAVGDETWLLLFETAGKRGRTSRSIPYVVGRVAELSQLEDYLADGSDDVLYVQGPLGIGKSALLAALAARCDELGCPCVRIDARRVPPTQEAIALEITGGPPARSPLERVARARALGMRGWVVIIDNFDHWQDARDDGAENPCSILPADCRVIVASRRSPDPRSWGASLRKPRVMALAVLGDEEIAELATSLGVPPEHVGDLVRRAFGHPLCVVTLAGTIRGAAELELGLGLDVAGRRELLEAASIPARVTEEILAPLLDDDVDPAAAFDVLATVAVPDASGIGYRMPLVVREALTRRLRARSPVRYADLQRRLVHHVGLQLEMETVSMLVPVLDDLLDSLDDRPLVRLLAGSRADRLPLARIARRTERAAIDVASAAFGDERAAAALLRRLDRGYAVTIVVEGADGIEGICQYVTITLANAARLGEIRDDTELASALELLRQRATLAADEHVIAVLSWIGKDAAAGAWAATSQSLFRRFFPIVLARPHAVGAIFTLPSNELPIATMDLPFCDAPEMVGPHSQIYSDLRGISPRAVLTALLEASDVRGTVHLPTVPISTPLISTATVREALLLLERPERLVDSPLLSLSVVAAEASADAIPADKAVVLERLLRQIVTSLGSGYREKKEREVLEAVYFERAGKHEKIAAEMAMPYSTFRRCLARGLERVAELVRDREELARRSTRTRAAGEQR